MEYEQNLKYDEQFLENKKNILTDIYSSLCNVLDDESNGNHEDRMNIISTLFGEYVKICDQDIRKERKIENRINQVKSEIHTISTRI